MNKEIELACIIDDDNVYVSLIRRIVKVKNLCKNLLIFKNGQEALTYFETLLTNLELEKIPEIIFIDLNMPVMDGWEFLSNFTKIKNKFGKVITLYVVSSSINPIDIEKAEKIDSVKQYLIKPVTIRDLEDIFKGKEI